MSFERMFVSTRSMSNLYTRLNDWVNRIFSLFSDFTKVRIDSYASRPSVSRIFTVSTESVERL